MLQAVGSPNSRYFAMARSSTQLSVFGFPPGEPEWTHDLSEEFAGGFEPNRLQVTDGGAW